MKCPKCGKLPRSGHKLYNAVVYQCLDCDIEYIDNSRLLSPAGLKAVKEMMELKFETMVQLHMNTLSPESEIYNCEVLRKRHEESVRRMINSDPLWAQVVKDIKDNE